MNIRSKIMTTSFTTIPLMPKQCLNEWRVIGRRILSVNELERLCCCGEHKVLVLTICQSNWKANEDTPSQKASVPFGKFRVSLPWECERFLPFLLHLAGNPHWEGNSEEILGGAGDIMESQGSSAGLAKGEQGTPPTKIPKLSFPFS